jgi:hypothetical protein
MAQNVGTLVSAAIRPNDSLDPIASAFASEIKGGLHTATASGDRDATIFERREWGMMCYVINDNKTYQLDYNYADTDIMNNSNWVEFSGSGGGAGNEWIDSVFSVLLTPPVGPSNGDRYLVGTKPSDNPTGVWGTYSPGFVAEWNSTLTSWDKTFPTEGMSVRVDNEDNSIYRYETDGGLNNYPSGVWEKEKLGQVRSIDANFTGGFSYSTTSDPEFSSYIKDMLFLTKFDTINSGVTASLNVNGLGDVLIKKSTSAGVTNLNPYDIKTDVVYSLVYDGTYFQLNKPSNDDLFNIKYYIEPTDYIVVPQYYQYWVYGDLTIDGWMENYGQVVIANGSLINSGTFANYGTLAFVSFAGVTGGVTTSYYDTDTIDFSLNNTILGPSVSAIVKNDSLTASHLNTGSNGGATAGYVLSVDDSGLFSWKEESAAGGGGVLSYSDKSYVMSTNTNGDGSPTGLTISNTPLENSYVGVFINGQEFQVGFGTTSSVPCYFSDDGGVTAKTSTTPNNVQIGDELYWNGVVVGTDLYSTWRISLFYQEE